MDTYEYWYIYRSITATFRKIYILGSHDLICINLYMIKMQNKINISWGSPEDFYIKIINLGSLITEICFEVYDYVIS